jgi:basic amino acid/polyamine antiporter, APA family
VLESAMGIAPKKELSIFDSTCIIVGIIIGAGIYETAPTVAACMGSWYGILGVWLVGGLLALTGALCYAELATTYPREGGDYVYLSHAYSKWAGYLFGWSQLVIIRPGDIALLAFIFSRYAQQIYKFPASGLFYVTSVIVLLTAINILGVKEGKWTQNLLTVIKVLGLLVIIIAGMLAPHVSPSLESESFTMEGLKLALLLVLFTFGGWNEMAYVAAEVRRPRQNIVHALIVGTIVVTTLYMLINGAFLYALGYEKMAASEAVAAETIAAVFPKTAGRIISVLVCISTLGAINGLIFTGSRISYAMGTEHALFRALGKWNQYLGTPVWALVVQGCISLAIVLLAGSFIDTILYTAPVVWLFFMATSLSVFVLRHKYPNILRPYKITGYPITPIVFCICSVFMFYNCTSYAFMKNPIGLLIAVSVLVIGALVYWLANIHYSSD